MLEAIVNTPLFGLTLCIGTYLLGCWIQKKTGWLLANPLLLAAAMSIALLVLLDIPYEAFALGGDFIHMMLGPVTALLSLGIYNQRTILKRHFVPVLVGCTAGSATSIGSVLLVCRLLGVDKAVTAAIMPKSCTTPIALSIAQSRGGLAAIAACCVIITGITGVLGAPYFAKWFGITDPVAQGLATGACSHALGTAKAREMGEVQGAMSSIAIGVCGLISVILSLIVPL